MKQISVLLIGIISGLSSCDQNSESPASLETHANAVPDTVDENLYGSALSTTRNEVFEEDTTTEILFPEFSVSIARLIVYDEQRDLQDIQQNDSVSIHAELGESIEAQRLTITSDQLVDITVEMRHETSVVISDEGPHCDLYDWKHSYSDWEELPRNQYGEYVCVTYNSYAADRFPEIDMDELREAVKAECGERWSDMIEDDDVLNESPAYVTLSGYILRITGEDKDSGEVITKIIYIRVPMGC